MVEEGRGLSELHLQSGVFVLRNHENSKSRDPTLVLGGVSSPKTVVNNVFLLNTDGLGNGWLQVRENLVAGTA